MDNQLVDVRGRVGAFGSRHANGPVPNTRS